MITYQEFASKFNIILNAQQEAAVKQVNGPTLLLAVPGSGKTTVIVARLGYMLYCQGIDPSSILTMTYTVSAKNDMRERFRLLFGDTYADNLDFRTINSLCVKIISHYERVETRVAFRLASDTDVMRILRDLYITIVQDYPTESDLKDIRTRITYCKNMLLVDDDIKNLEDLGGVNSFIIYSAYKEHMTKNLLMDFDDQLVYALGILKKHKEILEYFQDKYRYINVDEAQDTSKVQHLIIQMLATRRKNIFMVGDEDQSIYRFRAAYPQALLDFEKTFTDAKVLLMETNYRSTQTIVSHTGSFIKRNQSRHDKSMRTDNELGSPIKHSVLTDYSFQHPYVISRAQDNHGDTAILYRNNDSAIPLIDLLEKNNIAYQCRRVEGLFFSHVVVSDVLSAIRFSLDPCNWELFSTLYYKLGCGIKKIVILELMESAPRDKPVLDVLLRSGMLETWSTPKVESLKTSFSRIATSTSNTALNIWFYNVGYLNYLLQNHIDTTRVSILLTLAHNNRDLKRFIDRIGELQDIVKEGGIYKDSRIILSTIHSSKGLEYDNVILIDVVDGLFPNIATPISGHKLTDEELAQLEEERRLFYVGVTRAKKTVELISYKSEYGGHLTHEFSFIKQLLAASQPQAIQNAGKQIMKTAPKTHPPILKPKAVTDVYLKDYIPNRRVIHNKFGTGTIIYRDDMFITVKFSKDRKERKLNLSGCVENKLIRLA